MQSQEFNTLEGCLVSDIATRATNICMSSIPTETEPDEPQGDSPFPLRYVACNDSRFNLTALPGADGAEREGDKATNHPPSSSQAPFATVSVSPE